MHLPLKFFWTRRRAPSWRQKQSKNDSFCFPF